MIEKVCVFDVIGYGQLREGNFWQKRYNSSSKDRHKMEDIKHLHLDQIRRCQQADSAIVIRWMSNITSNHDIECINVCV